MEALLIDFTKCMITGKVEIKGWPNKHEEGMYYSTEIGMVPVAYCFKPKDRDDIKKILADLRKREQEFNRHRHNVITKHMRPFRSDQ